MLVFTLVTMFFCFVLERLFAAWKLPAVQGWIGRVLLLNSVQLTIVVVAGLSWENWLAASSVLNLSQTLSPWSAGFVAYFIATFVFYWWHRIRHQSDFFWRFFHQIHHSPQRLEVITSFYKHPLEMIANSLIGSLLIYTLLGLSVEAGAIYTLFTALGEFFYHTNVKTPRWVGYVFQRPEMHRVHHQFGSHKNNYGDFVIWDMLFGTYENPKQWSGACGFETNREVRLKDMLIFKDVHKVMIAGLLLISATVTSSSKAKEIEVSSWKQACEESKKVLQEGDLIFLDVPNFLFREVAASTNSWTSHVGVVMKNERGQWVVRESKIPLSKESSLCGFLKRSSEYRFEIKRYAQALAASEISLMKEKSAELLGIRYGLGFNLDSSAMFCSKYVNEVYQAIGVDVGQIQTFKELLEANPDHPITFWKYWFFGNIPWERRTITPASQLEDPKFFTVLESK